MTMYGSTPSHNGNVGMSLTLTGLSLTAAKRSNEQHSGFYRSIV